MAGGLLAVLAVVLDKGAVEVLPTVFDEPPKDSTESGESGRRRSTSAEDEEEEEVPRSSSAMPASVYKWTRLNVKTGAGSGKVVLAIQKPHPKRK